MLSIALRSQTKGIKRHSKGSHVLSTCIFIAKRPQLDLMDCSSPQGSSLEERFCEKPPMPPGELCPRSLLAWRGKHKDICFGSFRVQAQGHRRHWWKWKVKGQVEQDTSTDVSTNTNGRQDEDQENPKVWVVKSFLGFHILAQLDKSGKKVLRVSNLGVERSLPMLFVYSRNSEVITAHTVWLPRSHASVLCRSSGSYM